MTMMQMPPTAMLMMPPTFMVAFVLFVSVTSDWYG